MSIPDYETIMLPLLKLANDGQEHRVGDAVEQLARHFRLTNEERTELLPSGTATVFGSRVGWARTYLKQAGLLDSQRRGWFQITERGKVLIAKRPRQIDNELLDQYEEFKNFRARSRVSAGASLETPAATGRETPEDSLAAAYQKLRAELEGQLLDQIRGTAPAFFERVVIDLLVAMGYGGTRPDAAKAVGRSGDGGIDGIIKEDKLGLDVIYIQAKRWKDTVGRPEIQKFAGALDGHHARKGVMISTSNFSKDAERYADSIDKKIKLIDGAELAKLMVDHNIGVTALGIYEVKKIDADYFETEDFVAL